MSSISILGGTDNSISDFEYFTKRAAERALIQEEYDKEVYGQQKAMEFSAEDMPMWAKESGIDKDAIIRAEPDADSADDTNISKTEQFNNAVLAEMKANGNDIIAAVSTVKGEMFEELFAAKLEELKGDVTKALAAARQQIPGGLDDAELKDVLVEMVSFEYPLPDEVKDALSEVLNELETKLASTDFKDLLEENASSTTSDTYLTDIASTLSETNTQAQSANKNTPTSISEGYRMEAFAFTKSQFPDGVDLENNEDAKAMFDQRLADNMAGKNRNDRSVNMMHYIV